MSLRLAVLLGALLFLLSGRRGASGAGVRAPQRPFRDNVGKALAAAAAVAAKEGPPLPGGFRFAASAAAAEKAAPPPPSPPVPRGRTGAHAPATFTQMYTFGFNSDYYCSARISDEPRAMRLSCTKNPPRTMNCMCDHENANTLLVPCRCEPALTSTKKKINLVDKFVGT